MIPADRHGESIKDLAARLIGSVKAYARAEVAVVQRTASAWVSLATLSVVLVVVAIFLVQAALTTLAVALGFLLARWLDFPLGFALAALIVLAIAGLLVWVAAARLSKDKWP